MTRALSSRSARGLLRRDAARLAPICLAWALLVSSGVGALGLYSARPGDAGPAPGSWPLGETTADGDWERPRLTLVAHPRCPCTRATVSSLAHAAAVVGDRADMEVLAYVPEDAPDGWLDTGLLDAARRIPGLGVRPDPGGRLARALGAATSGHVVIYDESGRLRFTGGITPSRGHEGSCLGRAAMIDILLGRVASDAPVATTPVFGCPLRDACAPPDAGCRTASGEPKGS